MRDPDWLLDSEPREVQLEALRRSYAGFSLKDSKDGEPEVRQFRKGPDKGWGDFLEMRLGKTPKALNEFELFMRDYGFKRVVVFCPNTFKEGWVREALKSGASVPWFAYESRRENEARAEALKSKGVFGVAVNYEAVRTEKTRSFLSDLVDKKTLVIADESICLKGHTSLQSKAVREVAAEAGAVRLLSGLPMTQGPQDLYAQFRAIRRMEGVNFYSYRNRFCKMGGFKAKKVVGVKNEEKLQSLLESCSFVAKKKDWGKQTGAEYYQEELLLPPALKKHYDAMDRDLVTLLADGEEVSADMVVTKLGKLAQISSGFAYHEGRSYQLMDPKKTPKMERLLGLLEETLEKMVVVYNYTASGDALMECLNPYNPACIRSQDWMKKNGRDAESEKNRFNQDAGSRVMILQTTSGKYGHDLSGVDGDRCSKMVFYENTFSLDDRTQIEMRNTTAFQNWSNEYFDFVSSPVEERAISALAKKENVVNAVLGSFRDETG